MKRAILVTVPTDDELYATAMASDDPYVIAVDGDEQHTAILVEDGQPSYPEWLPTPDAAQWTRGLYVEPYDVDDLETWLQEDGRGDRHQVAFDGGTFVAD